MGKAYSDDLRQRCLDAMVGGETASSIATRFGVAKSSVIKWHQRYRDTGRVSPLAMGGHHGSCLEPYRVLSLIRTAHVSPYGLSIGCDLER